jgi:hypothetical protein
MAGKPPALDAFEPETPLVEQSVGNRAADRLNQVEPGECLTEVAEHRRDLGPIQCPPDRSGSAVTTTPVPAPLRRKQLLRWNGENVQSPGSHVTTISSCQLAPVLPACPQCSLSVRSCAEDVLVVSLAPRPCRTTMQNGALLRSRCLSTGRPCRGRRLDGDGGISDSPIWGKYQPPKRVTYQIDCAVLKHGAD